MCNDSPSDYVKLTRLKNSVLLFSLGLCAVFLFGCASRPKQIEAGEIETSISRPGYGLLFGSYCRPDPKNRFAHETISFRNIDTNAKYRIGIHTLPFVPLKFDYIEPSEAGSLFTFSLPAGEYEIYNFEVVQDTIAGPVTHYPMRKFSVRFSVEAGKACYLGSIQIFRHSGRFKFAVTGGVQFVMRENPERDHNLLRSKYPGIEWIIADSYPQNPPDLEMFRVIRRTAESSSTQKPSNPTKRQL